MKLNKRGHFVFGFIAGAVFALSTQFFMTHHREVIQESCHMVDEGIMCDWKWVHN